MVERSAEPRLTAPIVPDPNDELVAHSRSAAAPRPRTWPLWLLCMLLMAGLAAMAGLYWLDRQAWQATQRGLEGQLSNLHARFDSLDERRESNNTEEQLESLSATQQSMQARLAAFEGAMQRLDEQSVDDSRLAKLVQQLQAAEAARDTLTAALEAMQSSLDTLEQSGKEAREALASRLESVEAKQDDTRQRLQALNDTDGELAAQMGTLNDAYLQLQEQVESLPARDFAGLESRLDQLAADIEALQSGSGDQKRLTQLASQVASNQASLIELRQNQVGLSAEMESLSSRIE